MTYLSVVSRDSVRIMLTLVVLKNLDIHTADVQNAYLNAKPKERVYFYSRTEFGKDEGEKCRGRAPRGGRKILNKRGGGTLYQRTRNP